MKIFFCDLDNTLIYSHRRLLDPQRVGVERYQGEMISYMTPKSQALLAQVCERVLFVPTTARTPVQYARVTLGETPPDFALVCNGGLLLREGQVDEAWYAQTRALIAHAEAELSRAVALLEEDPDRSFEVRFLHELFLFSKSAEPLKTEERLRAQLDPELVSVFSQGVKIYVIPKQMTKAGAATRLAALLGARDYFAAGDSTMDAGMLLAAARAFAPQSLARTLPPCENLVAVPDELVFSEVFLQAILDSLV